METNTNAGQKNGKRVRNPLRKRVLREFRQDLGKTLALFLFMTIIIGFVSGFQVADLSMQVAYHEGFEKYHLEDGHFATEQEMTAEEIEELEEAEDIDVAPLFYKEKTSGENTLYVYNLEHRKDNNTLCQMEGKLPKKEDEIVLDRLYCENNHLSLGDTVEVGSHEMTLVGTVAAPDYSCLFKRNSDMMFDASSFSYAVVTEETFDNLGEGGLNYRYIWYNEETGLSEKETDEHSEDILTRLSDHFEEVNEEKGEDYAAAIEARLEENLETVLEALGVNLQDPASVAEGLDFLANLGDDEEAVEDLLEQESIKELTADIEEPEINYVTDFLQRGDNQAINFTGEDMGGDLVMITVLFYVLIFVLAFIFAVTIKSTVEKEASAIGTLRASGYTRGELVRHYMVVPLLTTLAAALVGNVLGYTIMKNYSVGLYYHSYSLPTYETVWNGHAFLLTTVASILIVLVVVFLSLTRALRLPPLQFLRGELTQTKKKRVRPLRRGGFFTRFRLRVVAQNLTTYLVLFMGLALASLILIFGSALVPLLNHFGESIDESKIADYQYILKAEVETENKEAEKYSIATLVEERNDEEIMVYGISEDSRYLPLDFSALKEGDGTKDDPVPVYVSTNYLSKFHLEKGDVIHLKEKYTSKEHYFKIEGDHRYDAALAIFLPRKTHNKVFGEKEDFYSGYFSNEKLTDLDEDYVAAVITEQDLKAVSNQLQDSMGGMMNAVRVFCVIAYMLLIYLLTKVIVDRNARNIGLLKILGYTNREAGSLYNRATGVIVVVSQLLILPLVCWFFAILWDIIMLRMHGYLVMWLPPWMAPFLVGMGLLAYFLIYPVLMRRVRKIPAGVVLKGME